MKKKRWEREAESRFVVSGQNACAVMMFVYSQRS